MRRSGAGRVLLLMVVLASACAPAAHNGVPGLRGTDLVRVTLLQVNDLYTLEPVDGGRRGGMARLATLVTDTKRRQPNTVFALAGDTLSPSVVSTFLKGEQMIAAFNLIGLDVATFGNHEFDFGPAVLRERMRESKFVWLSANVRDANGTPFGGAAPALTLTLGGIRVGVFGLTMPETAATSSPGRDVVFADAVTTGRATAAELRRAGAELVVAVTHQDMARDRALAEAADVDVILGGHEHEPAVVEEGRTLITKAGADGRYLVQIDLWLRPGGGLVERTFAFREVSARVRPDPAVAELVTAYTARLNRELDVVVGQAGQPLEARRARLRTEETNVGNFVADVMRERMRTQVAVVNGGGIRTDRIVPAGPLTRRDVHMLLPFTNVVMTLEMSGRDLRAALEQGLAQVEREGGGFLQVSGLAITYDPRRPAGSRIVRLEIAGQPAHPEQRYSVAVIDYLARGGDGLTAFAAGKVLIGQESGPQLADLVLDAIVTAGTIAPRVEGRIRAVGR